MASFNKVILMGNLTRDPQLRYLPQNNTPVCDFGLACNRRWKTPTGEDREEVTFVDCTAWNKTAELVNKYFTKGKPIFVEGRLKYDSWDDKQGGGKRSRLVVIVENFQFIGAPPSGAAGSEFDSGGAEASRPPQSRPARPAGGSAPQAPQAQPPFGDEQQFKEDDIPF